MDNFLTNLKKNMQHITETFYDDVVIYDNNYDDYYINNGHNINNDHLYYTGDSNYDYDNYDNYDVESCDDNDEHYHDQLSESCNHYIDDNDEHCHDQLSKSCDHYIDDNDEHCHDQLNESCDHYIDDNDDHCHDQLSESCDHYIDDNDECKTEIEHDTINLKNIIDDFDKSKQSITISAKDIQHQQNHATYQYNDIYTHNNINDENIKFDNDILIKNLYILSILKIKQKLFINNIMINNKIIFEISIDDSLLPQISRWYYKQNRTNTINTIDNLIDSAILRINYYKYLKNEEQILKLINLLQNSITGLINLKITYETDNKFTLKITKIINKINDFLTFSKVLTPS